MNIYFSGSIHGGRQDASVYEQLVRHLKIYGDVLSEHVGSLNLRPSIGVDPKFIHDRDMLWLQEADVVVAEVSVPSLGVGYEIGCAIAEGKPVLCLHRNGSEHPLSAMIEGSPTIQVVRYEQIENALGAISDFFSQPNVSAV